MPRLRRRGHVASVLTLPQEIELILGPGCCSTADFANDQERREKWRRHRDEIMASANDFSRPWAFWAFEVGRIPSRENGEREVDLLRELNLLTAREQAMLAGDPAFVSMLLRERRQNA